MMLADAARPPLESFGGTMNNLLGRCHGVDSGHKSFLDVELIVDGLYHGGKTVGGTRGTGDKLHVGSVLVLVNTHNNGWGVVLGRGREDDFLDTRVDVRLA